MTSPHHPTDDGAGRVVVALDGSPSSARALRQGARVAEALGLCIKVVTVWHQTDQYGGYLGGPLDPEATETTAIIRAMQENAVKAVFGASPPTGLEQTVVEGPTVEMLLDESRRSEMLVLGSRGHGGCAGLLLGTVSAACAAHAACPVLVCRFDVPGRRARTDRGDPRAAGRSGSPRRPSPPGSESTVTASSRRLPTAQMELVV